MRTGSSCRPARCEARHRRSPATISYSPSARWEPRSLQQPFSRWTLTDPRVPLREACADCSYLNQQLMGRCRKPRNSSGEAASMTSSPISAASPRPNLRFCACIMVLCPQILVGPPWLRVVPIVSEVNRSGCPQFALTANDLRCELDIGLGAGTDIVVE